MNENIEQLSTNRAKADAAFILLVSESREIVYRLIKPVADQGKFSLDDVAVDSRGNLRSLDDIAHTTDPSALLGVLSTALKDNDGPPALSIPGISYRLADKVRHFRNDFAHFEAEFSDPVYVQDNIKSVNDLRLGLLNARPRPPVRQHEPSETVLRSDTTLHGAVQNRQAARLNALLAAGVDANARGRYSHTPLYEAAQKGYLEIAQTLIIAGADVNAASFSNTPLHSAAENGHLELAQALIAAGADVNATSGFANTPLHSAARNGHLEVAQTLIAESADVNAKDIFGITPLHIAAQKVYLDMAQALIAAGADVNATNIHGDTPLHFAVDSAKGYEIHHRQAEIANALIVAGADVNAKGIHGDTPLQIAESCRLSELVNLLKPVTKRKRRIKTPIGFIAIAAFLLFIVAIFLWN